MKYDLISVRSTRTPYKVSRPVDIYAAFRRYATSKVEKFFAISLDGQPSATPALLVEGTRRVFRRYHPRENEFAYDLDGPAGLDYERRLASLSRRGPPEATTSMPVQAP